jgi:hypothetical protein
VVRAALAGHGAAGRDGEAAREAEGQKQLQQPMLGWDGEARVSEDTKTMRDSR